MRSNSAIALCTSTPTWSIEPTGKKSRLWSVVNATIVPAQRAGSMTGCSASRRPIARYTNAGVIEKKIWMVAKNERPIICWRI